MKNWKRFLALALCCVLLCCLVPCTQASAEIFVDEYGGVRFTTFEDLKELCSRTYEEGSYISYPYNDAPTIVIEENITIPENLEVSGQYVTFVVPAGVTVTISDTSTMYVTNWDVKGTLVNHGRMEPANLTVSGTMRNDGYVGLLFGGSSDLIVTGKIENSGRIEIQCGTDPEFAGTVSGLDKITHANGGETSAWYPFVYSMEDLDPILADAIKNPGILFAAEMHLQESITFSSDFVVPENVSLHFPRITEDMTVTIPKGCTVTNNGILILQAPTYISGTLRNEKEIQIWGEEKLNFASGSRYTGNGVIWAWYVEAAEDAVKGLDMNDYLVEKSTLHAGQGMDVWGIWPKNVKANVTRLAGDNRFDTAIKAADEMLAASTYGYFETIIIANGYNFADALSGSYLANVLHAPILLCWSGDSKYDYLNDAVVEYVTKHLNAVSGTVYLLGGTSAVPQSLEDALNEHYQGMEMITINRLAGKDRFETNLMILEEATAKLEQWGMEPDTEILVCTATNFADSLSASATGKPILLAFNEYGKLYGGQEAYLKTLEGCSFTVIGGESAVSAKLADAFKQFGSVSRLAGGNRFETSVLVAEKYFDDPHSAVLAYAWNFPDGLCGGPLAYSMGAPLILTMTKYESQAVKYFADKAIIEAFVLGGDTLISDKSVRGIFALEADAKINVK